MEIFMLIFNVVFNSLVFLFIILIIYYIVNCILGLDDEWYERHVYYDIPEKVKWKVYNTKGNEGDERIISGKGKDFLRYKIQVFKDNKWKDKIFKIIRVGTGFRSECLKFGAIDEAQYLNENYKEPVLVENIHGYNIYKGSVQVWRKNKWFFVTFDSDGYGVLDGKDHWYGYNLEQVKDILKKSQK